MHMYAYMCAYIFFIETDHVAQCMNPKEAMNQSMKNETFVITVITFPSYF